MSIRWTWACTVLLALGLGRVGAEDRVAELLAAGKNLRAGVADGKILAPSTRRFELSRDGKTIGYVESTVAHERDKRQIHYTLTDRVVTRNDDGGTVTTVAVVKTDRSFTVKSMETTRTAIDPTGAKTESTRTVLVTGSAVYVGSKGDARVSRKNMRLPSGGFVPLVDRLLESLDLKPDQTFALRDFDLDANQFRVLICAVKKTPRGHLRVSVSNRGTPDETQYFLLDKARQVIEQGGGAPAIVRKQIAEARAAELKSEFDK